MIPHQLKEAAISYAGDSHLSIFPVHYINPAGRCSCGGKPGCTPGKHPRTPHGHLQGTHDLNRVKAWWKMWPNSNIGLHCMASGIVVIDIDPRSGGHLTLKSLEEANGPLPITLTASTGTQDGIRGQHRYFRAPEGDVTFKGTMGAGVDVKYHGYVIMPPSRHPSGVCYEWVNPKIPIADLPEWVEALIMTPTATPERTPQQTGRPIGDSLTNQLGLKVENYLWPSNAHPAGRGEVRGSHPVHGSTGGANLCVNVNKNTWYCFRHGVGGGPIEALAVARGIVRCEDIGLLSDHWHEILSELEADGHDLNNDPEAAARAEAFLKFVNERKRARID